MTTGQPARNGRTGMTGRGSDSRLLFAVTGSSGFVGRHLIEWLLRQGHRVRCLSRQLKGHPGTDHRHLHDYLDVPALSAALSGCDVVVHLAARAHVLDDAADSAEDVFLAANLDSTVSVATAALAEGVHRFVLLSSIGVNGSHTGEASFKADDPPAPQTPYAVSKWRAEMAVADVLADSATEWVILRPTLVYGADCPGNFESLLRLVHRLPIVPLGGLRKPRSLVYVDNLCDAIMLAAWHPNAAGRIFLLSDGVDLTVAELVHALARGLDKPARRLWALPEPLLRLLAIASGNRRAIDKLAGALAVDSRAFQVATGWTAPYSPSEALAKTAQGYLAAQIR